MKNQPGVQSASQVHLGAEKHEASPGSRPVGCHQVVLRQFSSPGVGSSWPIFSHPLLFQNGHKLDLIFTCSIPDLLQTHENREHLVMMEKILGPIPSHMIHRTR